MNNFSLMQYHHYSLSELEAMMPWERKSYIGMVAKHVQEENERIRMSKEKASADRAIQKRIR